MKWILFFLPAICCAQLASFSTPAPMVLECWTGPAGILHRGVTSIQITNNGTDTLQVWLLSLSDTDDFEWQGILSPMAPSEQRRVDIHARRNVFHDTDCTVSFATNDAFRWRQVFVHGYKSQRTNTIRGEVVATAKQGRGIVWRDYLGREADTSRTGVYFAPDGQRKVVLR